MDEGRNMILLFPTLIKFKSEEAKQKFKPHLHMFYKERVIDIPGELHSRQEKLLWQFTIPVKV